MLREKKESPKREGVFPNFAWEQSSPSWTVTVDYPVFWGQQIKKEEAVASLNIAEICIITATILSKKNEGINQNK